MNEFELIARLTASLPSNGTTVVGAGDDCAVLDLGLADQFLLFKTDAIVQGIHFTGETPPRSIGRKALARCLSDVAAMAGTPTHVLVTIALPREFDVAIVEEVYAGMAELAKEHDVAIVGGETTENPGGLLLSISLLGTAPKGKCILRSGARPGDAIFVSGELGGSIDGKHLSFQPRLHEARWLAEHVDLHAMIDLSDGLAGDLRHVLKAGNVGAELLADAIPISRAARRKSGGGSSSRTPLLAALSDGEDFELLFAVAARDSVPLLDAWKQRFSGLRLSCIGKITGEPGLRIRDRRGRRQVSADGYVHFQNS